MPRLDKIRVGWLIMVNDDATRASPVSHIVGGCKLRGRMGSFVGSR
jgi:hypothetical protein